MGIVDFSVKEQLQSLLHLHPVHTIDRLHPRKPAVLVKNFHFEPVSIECSETGDSAVFGKTMTRHWRKADEEDISRFKEGIRTAIYVLYALNLPSGQCVVQRESVRDYSVYRVNGSSLLEKEGLFIGHPKRRMLSYGADVECLIQNQKTGGWVSASSITPAENGSIGYDGAISVKGKKVLRPILELRPQPATNAFQLHQNLHLLYEKLETYVTNNDLKVIGAGFGRFHVGGHLHVGSHPLTFQDVRKLDLFLAIPFSLMESSVSPDRRHRYGRLGSARRNDFAGFEYRTLPSWYSLIPELRPVLEWFCYINEHPDHFPVLNFTSEMLRGYYCGEAHDLTNVSKEIEHICRNVLPFEDYYRYAVPFFRLIHRNEGVL
ncbi:MAG TPA: hypothetical protein VFT51_15215 [Bacillales bacterium]|nr:hypothetical protein [Bacillales bacterium]